MAPNSLTRQQQPSKRYSTAVAALKCKQEDLSEGSVERGWNDVEKHRGSHADHGNHERGPSWQQWNQAYEDTQTRQNFLAGPHSRQKTVLRTVRDEDLTLVKANYDGNSEIMHVPDQLSQDIVTAGAFKSDRRVSEINHEKSSNQVSPARWRGRYHIDWRPREVFLKFRQRMDKFRVGANIEFRRHDGSRSKKVPSQVDEELPDPLFSLAGFQAQSYHIKLVIKPQQADRNWKVLCDPQYGLRFLTRKIPIGNFLRLQVGIGHDFKTHTTGWKWKVTSVWGSSNLAQVRHKSVLPICPGVDARIGWSAEYNIPNLHGAMGTGEPFLNLNKGRLYASVDRLEVIMNND